MKYSNTVGASQQRPGLEKRIEWEFFDIDKDGVLDLNETRTVIEERFNRDNIVTTNLYRYVFKNNQFFRYIEFLKKKNL